MMKRWMIAGALAVAAATAVVFGAMYADTGDSRSATQIALDYRSSPVGSETVYADGYEVELPSDWQIQHSEVLLDLEADGIIREATGDRIYDNRFYEYAEPGSLTDNVFPTNIMIHTAKSDLVQDEYEDALFDIMAASEEHYGIDISLLNSRWGELGGRPAMIIEYAITSMPDSDLPTVRVVETITTADTALYSISYGGELDDYHEHLHHFDHAVKTFKFE